MDERKNQQKTIFEHKYICTLAKSVTAEGIELPILSGRVRNLTAELTASAVPSINSFFFKDYVRYAHKLIGLNVFNIQNNLFITCGAFNKKITL